jgi:hypothetical protein
MSKTPGPSVSLKDSIQVAPDVVFRVLDGQAVLLNLKTGVYFGLNEMGTDIWNNLVENGSLEAAYQRILKEYDVEPELAARDLLRITTELLDKGLVSLSSAK